MAEVPKSVRARLAAQPISGEHLEANVLTAFAEKTLTEREREPVFAHLASCAECREVLSLMAPSEAPPVAVATKQAPRQSWIYRPFVRWGAVAVAAIVIVAAALLHRPTEVPVRSDAVPVANERPKSTGDGYAKLEIPPTASTRAKAAPAAESSNRKLEPRKDKAAAQAPQESATLDTRAPVRKELSGKDSRGELKTKPAGLVGGVVGNPQAAADQVPPPPAVRVESARVMAAMPSPKPAVPPPPPPSVTNTAAAESATAEVSPMMRDALVRQSTMAKKAQAAQGATASPSANQSADQAATQPTNQAAKQSATAANTVVLQSVPARGLGGYTQGQQRQPVVTRIVWSITPDGQVVRTVREDVEPQPVTIASGVRFHAVAAVGQSDVWAGGEGGALYHSADNGNRWTRVPLPTSDAVVAFEFSSRREGTLTTSGGQKFVTVDAGRTWKVKQ